MRNEKTVEINVKTVFAGKRTDKQAFVDLILYKMRSGDREQALESSLPAGYNNGVVFPDVHAL
ncbi:MAG: hypothetical protein LBS19_07250 [Clostridiales bacterium]|jgi:hypothetical protein|nr:hypothetical protein [Clostridiales bacterium]